MNTANLARNPQFIFLFNNSFQNVLLMFQYHKIQEYPDSPPVFLHHQSHGNIRKFLAGITTELKFNSLSFVLKHIHQEDGESFFGKKHDYYWQLL